jgi:hypothetical protein
MKRMRVHVAVDDLDELRAGGVSAPPRLPAAWREVRRG